jgi:hypothetical protein
MSYTHKQFLQQPPRQQVLLPVRGNRTDHLWVGPGGKKLGYTPTRDEAKLNSYRIAGDRVRNPETVNVQPLHRAGDLLGTGATILGSASLAAPALAPVAAGLGVGYGLYKLGETFKLW